ncbi:hypothetical protein GGR56DRAFT_641575 [Xylariaceae sp. FL0804]|nr:hypothetical protein GGR56DRAFT_641575 [Xylariaceae sp. FL0804]
MATLLLLLLVLLLWSLSACRSGCSSAGLFGLQAGRAVRPVLVFIGRSGMVSRPRRRRFVCGPSGVERERVCVCV